MRTPYFVMFIFLLGLSHASQSEENQDEHAEAMLLPVQIWSDFNKQAVTHYLIPGYRNFHQQTSKLNNEITAFCALKAKKHSDLKSSQQAFHKSMDAWQAIQNIQFGPIQLLMRNYSIQFWPDKKNHVGKHLAALIDANSPADLENDAFRKTSVSLKGLPALERFLFEDDFINALIKEPYACQLMQRISTYLENTSNALEEEWQEMQTHFTHFPNAYFQNELSASTALLKSLVEPLEVIRDLKLLRPIGSEYGQQKATRLESWRSQRSLTNIKQNMSSLRTFFTFLAPLLTQAEIDQIDTLFETIEKRLTSFNTPLESAIDNPQGHANMVILAAEIKALHDSLDMLIAAKGIHLGFNSRDGD